MQKIAPFLWFDDQAEEAVKFYTSVFKNSKAGRILRYGEEAAKVSTSRRPVGSVLTIEFELEGQKFVALKRRTALQIQRINFLRRELRGAGRSRLFLGETHC
jgi:predicted 3-demethylubiquinone-9 3-methyltransferase (glyoxalase superfamily)